MIDLFPDLSIRSGKPELMDDYQSNEKKLINTVKQFTLLNLLFTRSRGLIKKYLLPDILNNQEKKITFLDIGAGGCDIPLWLLKKCKKKGVDLIITCLDNDKRIINYARNKCIKYPEIKIIEASAFDLEKLDSFDYIFANHFLHHLPTETIIKLLKLIMIKTSKIFLLNDIYRSNLAYIGYSLFTGVFMHNSFAFYDGRLSIKKGFIEKDFEGIIKKIKFSDKIKIIRVKPARICFLGIKK